MKNLHITVSPLSNVIYAGDVTKEMILNNALKESMLEFSKSMLDGSLTFNDVIEFRSLFQDCLEHRIRSWVRDELYERDLIRAGL